jgi:hypothetical protein
VVTGPERWARCGGLDKSAYHPSYQIRASRPETEELCACACRPGPRPFTGSSRFLLSLLVFRLLNNAPVVAIPLCHEPIGQSNNTMDLEDRKPQLRFDYEGFSVGEQTKVDNNTAGAPKQRKMYNCVSPPLFLITWVYNLADI